MKKINLILFFSLINIMLHAQQVSDDAYKPTISNPEYQSGKGPVVFIDESHHNFHTKTGRYKAFSNLLERDGYNVKPYKGVFEKKKLSQGKILVISNALHQTNVENWFVPILSAFTKTEIAHVKQWVYEGGSLFLIADHMPMAGAAKALATAFDFEFTNGFAVDTLRNTAFFTIEEKTLIKNSITLGRSEKESVRRIATFTGQAFKIPADAKPILIFDHRYINLLPDTAWVFHKKTPRYAVKGWAQGAYKSYGKGRVVVFGEAAMFTAQLAGPRKLKVGMNRDDAAENHQLLLNIIHWLDKKMD